jgi:hypothetical protein
MKDLSFHKTGMIEYAGTEGASDEVQNSQLETTSTPLSSSK